MPLLDMPLEKLKEYKGRTPRPADFDAFWTRAIKELDDTKPNPELIPSTFNCSFADCFDLYYTGVRGARIHAKYLRPKTSNKPHPAVLSFHGYTGSAGDWSGYLNFVGQGFSVAAMDCRGQGGKSEDIGGVKGNTFRGHIIRGLESGPDNLLFRHIFLDTAQLARVVMAFDEVDEKRVGALGGSQGGGLTIACASLAPDIKRAAPCFPFLCDYQRVWEMDLAKGAYEELKDWLKKFDPRHERIDSFFNSLGYIDLQHLSDRIRGEVLMFTGLMDDICPPSTQFAAYNKMKTTKNVVIYPDFGHEGLPDVSDITFRFMAKL